MSSYFTCFGANQIKVKRSRQLIIPTFLLLISASIKWGHQLTNFGFITMASITQYCVKYLIFMFEIELASHVLHLALGHDHERGLYKQSWIWLFATYVANNNIALGLLACLHNGMLTYSGVPNTRHGSKKFNTARKKH